MKLFPHYVLVVDQDADAFKALRSRLRSLNCEVVVTKSIDQAMVHVSQQSPYLVILVGNDRYSPNLIHHLRQTIDAHNVTIVALTDFQAPNWSYSEENPGVDGFLVQPLDSDILVSLVQSAWARQSCDSQSMHMN